MWDAIAFKALGSESYTDGLIKANLQYRETVIFPAGVVLRLPAIEPEASATLPPWKEAGNEEQQHGTPHGNYNLLCGGGYIAEYPPVSAYYDIYR